MKRGTPDHPKMFTLAESLYGYLVEQGVPLSFELCHTLACGIFERLCHFTARYAPAGDIGKHSDVRIARAMGWTLDPAWLINTLVECRQLDSVLNGARLYVHDWHDHSDDAADKWLYDHKLRYANGSLTRRGRKSRQDSDEVATQTRQSEPESESYTEPESYPPSPPRPRIAVATKEGGDSWKSVLKDLKALGVNDAATAVKEAKANDLKPQDVAAIISRFRECPGAWNAGALYFRVRSGSPDTNASEGWPPPDKAYVDAAKQREASADRRKQADEQARTSAADRESKSKLEREFGHRIDSMNDADIAGLVNGNIVIEARLKRQGRTAPLVREYLLGELAKKEGFTP